MRFISVPILGDGSYDVGRYQINSAAPKLAAIKLLKKLFTDTAEHPIVMQMKCGWTHLWSPVKQLHLDFEEA